MRSSVFYTLGFLLIAFNAISQDINEDTIFRLEWVLIQKISPPNDVFSTNNKKDTLNFSLDSTTMFYFKDSNTIVKCDIINKQIKIKEILQYEYCNGYINIINKSQNNSIKYRIELINKDHLVFEFKTRAGFQYEMYVKHKINCHEKEF